MEAIKKFTFDPTEKLTEFIANHSVLTDKEISKIISPLNFLDNHNLSMDMLLNEWCENSIIEFICCAKDIYICESFTHEWKYRNKSYSKKIFVLSAYEIKECEVGEGDTLESWIHENLEDLSTELYY